MSNQVEVEIIARLDGLEKSLKEAQKASEKAGKKIGEDLGSSVEKSVGKAFGSIKASVLGVGAAILSGMAFGKVIDAAASQQDAINKMNQSLAAAGRFSIAASTDIQEFANQLQRTTTVEDDAVLGLVALASNFAKTNEQAKQLTSAALDMAAATGKSAEEAVRNLGMSLTGTTGRLAQMVPAVRGFTEDQLRAGAAISLVADRFRGMAASEVNTFSGAIKQLSNTFGDLLESLGDFIIQSPVVRDVIKFISAQLMSVTESVTAFGKSGDVMGGVIKSLINFAMAVNTFVVAPIELVVNLAKSAFNAVATGVQTVVVGIAAATFGITSLLAGVSDKFAGVNESARLFMESSTEVLADFSNQTADSLANTLDFGFAAKGQLFLEDLQFVADNAKSITTTMKNNISANTVDSGNKFKELGTLLNSTINNLVSSGVASIGAALVQGSGAFGSFAKTALNIMGDFAIQLGTMIVAADQAVIALKASLLNFFGGAGIVAGLALIAVGGALKAFAGGPAGKGIVTPAAGVTPGAGGGINAGTTAPIGESVSNQTDIQERQVASNISVNIEGNVLGDKRTLGREIADAINEAFGAEGIVIAKGVAV